MTIKNTTIIAAMMISWYALKSNDSYSGVLAVIIVILAWLGLHTNIFSMKKWRKGIVMGSFLVIILSVSMLVSRIVTPATCSVSNYIHEKVSTVLDQDYRTANKRTPVRFVLQKKKKTTQISQNQMATEFNIFEEDNRSDVLQSLSLEAPDFGNQSEQIIAYVNLGQNTKDDDCESIKYLKEAVFTQFDGQKWLTENTTTHQVKDDDDGVEDGWTMYREETGMNTYTYQVIVPALQQKSILLLPGTFGVALPEISVTKDGIVMTEMLIGNYTDYFAYASSLDYEKIKFNKLSPGKPGDEYLTMPKSRVIREFASKAEELTKGQKEVNEKVYSINKFFHNEFQYELNPERKITLDEFFKVKRGHCTLFATAHVMMLRSIGVPARIAYGYLSHSYNKTDKQLVFRYKDCHSWTEAYFDDYGWVTIDPTPYQEESVYTSEDGYGASMNVNNSDVDKPAIPSSLIAGDNSTIILLFLLLGAMIIYLPFILKGKSVHPKKQKKTAKNKPLTSYLEIFCHHYTNHGFSKKASQTLLEYVSALKTKGLINHEWDDLVNYYYAIQYENQEASYIIEKEFIARVKQLKKDK